MAGVAIQDGDTALHIAARTGMDRSVEAILNHTSSDESDEDKVKSFSNKSGKTPWDVSIKSKITEMITSKLQIHIRSEPEQVEAEAEAKNDTNENKENEKGKRNTAGSASAPAPQVTKLAKPEESKHHEETLTYQHVRTSREKQSPHHH